MDIATYADYEPTMNCTQFPVEPHRLDPPPPPTMTGTSLRMYLILLYADSLTLPPPYDSKG